MINDSDYYLFRTEKVIEDKSEAIDRTLYIIDFVVESDFEDFITNDETMDVQQQERVKNLITEYRSSHTFLRGIQEKLKEDEVFQLSKRIVNYYFEDRLESIFFMESLEQYNVFYNRLIGSIDIINNHPRNKAVNKKIEKIESAIGKRKMTRKYSKEYSFLSDKKLLERGL